MTFSPTDWADAGVYDTPELKTIVPSTTVRDETECNDGVYAWSGRG